MKRTEISSIGEFGLIKLLTEKTQRFHAQTIKGVGDDAAVWDTGEKYLVCSTDLLIEGIHFDLTYMPLKHLGYKAIAVNISDIAAMNALPTQILVSIAVSNRFSVEALQEIYEGIHTACQNYKVDLVGGDTTASRSGLFISVMALGEVAKDKITYRNTARKGDIICVTGDLGAAYMGLQVLEREKQVFLANPDMQPELEGRDYVVRRQLRPEARTDIIYELADLQVVPTAMIDISDGLASEILHLCTQSGLGAMIYEDKLPIAQETYDAAINDFNISPITAALNGGEDYELLFSIRQEDYEKIKLHPEISTIGYFTEPEKQVHLVLRSGNTAKIQAQGWQHFKG
ncbi:MAG: thiamine-phosphate kinase [Raineya sp.]|nr:thiamine-phosphate kinase [Raineya sp.]MDW8297388.1 thiamine-phosphate kinase [Raineya sp.]